MKTGLVLEGGAMRGMFTCGVLDRFMEKGLKFDGVIGVSAGALFGVNLLSGQAGRALRYNMKYNGDRRYMGAGVLLRTGNYFDTGYAYGRVPRELDPFDDKAFADSGVPFWAVVTNVDSGEAEYIRLTGVFRQMDVLRASGSMPFVSQKVVLDGKEYLDGGIADPIPFEAMVRLGFERLVVVLTRPEGYVKKPMAAAPAKLMYRKYPRFVETMLKRHEVYNGQLERLREMEARGEALVIRPHEAVDVKRTERDPEKLRAAHDMGFMDARVDEVAAFLER